MGFPPKIYNWRFLDVAKSYSDCLPYKLENDEKTKHLTEDDLGSVLDEKETAIEAQKEPVTIEADDQGLTEINETSINEPNNSSNTETISFLSNTKPSGIKGALFAEFNPSMSSCSSSYLCPWFNSFKKQLSNN